MQLEIEISSVFCYPHKFIINGIIADEDDFINKYDRSPELAGPHACADMQATRINHTDKVLDKYKITIAEYGDICDKLEKGLSFGYCGRCV